MNPPTGPVLRDIHLPPPPGWWPPAPGWWILAGLALALMLAALYKLQKSLKRRRRDRAVLRELEACIAAHRNEPAALAGALSRFLRRMALRDANAAAYAGERWLEYLDMHAGSEDFRRGVGRVLLEAPFRAQADYDTVALIALVRRYVRNALQYEVAHA